ncbi:putative MFS family arabinose efflux permease [Dysgonomonas alginatilytica]|uniref:Putative MFS family arabinose efflux permease n=1 Tax=Dysgonomonas alginatilytica TaxID=1605892 RepID=A0A2V3PK47_9BACT|nr:MFS transporter [Dysgonomonas alginatilytica]PXV59289.1 putative MFS family arabinose efflux permease [Dysgonomonas alginatilytica]
MEPSSTPKLWTLSYLNVCIANFLMACSFNLLMPSIPLYITEHLGVPQTKTGIVLASYAIAILMIRPFSGYLVDLYPRKKILLISFICYVAIFFGYFYAVTIFVFIIVRFFHGLTWGLSTVSSSTLAIDIVPSERRAEGIGYFGTFMNVAMAIGPFIAIHIYQNYSFQILLYCAIFMGILGIIAVSFIKAPERPKLEREKISFDRFFLLPAWPIFLNQLLPSFAWGTIGPFVAQYGKQINIPNAGIFFLFWAGGIIASRIFSGRMVDKGYIHLVNTSAMGIVAVAFLAFALIHNIVAFCVSGLFIGIGFGMMFPALQTLYINMAENNQRGTANSTYLVGFDLGLALGMLVGGYISGIYSFEVLFLVASGLCFFSIVVYQSISKRLYNRKKLR